MIRSPSLSKYGSPVNVTIGTSQELNEPLSAHSSGTKRPSTVCTIISYPVMGAPPSSEGDYQLKETEHVEADEVTGSI